MPHSEKNDIQNIQFDSSDGVNKVSGWFYTSKKVEPFCVLQISHGMCEYIGRYEHFALSLAQRGVAVCGNDHIGHGDTAAAEDDLGYFEEKNGRRYALLDLKTMNKKAYERFPGLPVILLGHSMGSFFARKYAAQWPDTINGLILSGTGGPNPLAGMGIFLTNLLCRVKGRRYRSEFIHQMAFKTYLKQIENPKTPYDWVSRDEDIVASYEKDPKTNFRFTVSGFYELFSALRDVSSPEWAKKIPATMPVMMLSGDADPVGDYGRGVQTVYTWLQDAGIKEIEYHMYAGGRHEMINEINRQEVYEDIFVFLQKHFKS